MIRYVIQPGKFILLIVYYLFSCNNNVNSDSHSQSDGFKSDQYLIRVFKNEDGTYGYLILKGEKSYIRQPNIPGISQNQGFKDSVSADKVARLVLNKLNSGVFPPTVSDTEILKIIKKN